ncbi:MAG TPA: L,D-transpeptidase [Thermoanaerobaculia bacterium]|nr:L,D-transpeptidase [Thermoanaerobaculia bacterium]
MVTRLASLAAFLLAATLQLAAQESIEGLPPDASHTGTVITIDVSTNQAYLFRDGQLVRKSSAATGSDKVLRKGRSVWWFRTPRGKHQVVRKIKDPVWNKPDWAFVEEGKPIPPPDSPLREERGTMGKYALDLGERVMIHGTNDPKSIGRRVSHGCIRLPNDMLTLLWNQVEVGTEVYIFDSNPQSARLAGSETGLNDLDM